VGSKSAACIKTVDIDDPEDTEVWLISLPLASVTLMVQREWDFALV
jgi:hypothetical protein